MKKRILFVDDEPNILEAMQNRLRRQRKKWDMTFVGSGREALEALENDPYDVIVSDMRMPEMDGAALLEKVQTDHPSVARIVLSGHSEMESTLRAVPVAHQFLTKPCQVGVLENVVTRSCALQELLSDEKVREIVGGIEKLPPLPRVYTELTAALTNPDADIDDVAKVLKQDMAICAKLLQIVNSAFFRLARTITRVEDAVSYLGFNSIKQIALAAEVFHYSKPGKTLIPLETLQTHAMLVGSLAGKFFEDKKQMEDAFVVGLLHDIGKLVMVNELPEHMEKVLQLMEDQGCTMHDAEVDVCGVSHAEIGGYLLGLWGLPYPIVEAVANHHEPTRVPLKEFDALAAAHIADALICEESPGEEGAVLNPRFAEAPSLVGKFEGWREMARELTEASLV